MDLKVDISIGTEQSVHIQMVDPTRIERVLQPSEGYVISTSPRVQELLRKLKLRLVKGKLSVISQFY